MLSEMQLQEVVTRELCQAGWHIIQEENGIDVLPLTKHNDGSFQAPVKIQFWECKLKEKRESTWAIAPLRFRACCYSDDGYLKEEDQEFLQVYVYKQILEHFRLANHLLYRTSSCM